MARHTRDSLQAPRQPVDLPSQNEMENDEHEKDHKDARRERIDHKDGCRYDPEHPEHHAQSAKAAAEDWGPQHAHPEDGDTYRQEDEPCEEQRVEHALVRLPQEDECRLILGGRPGRVIEVGDTGGNDVRESSGREHYETQNADDASKESRREARLPESAVQSEEEGDPHDEDQQVEAVLYGAGRSDVGEPFDGPVEAGRSQVQIVL